MSIIFLIVSSRGLSIKALRLSRILALQMHGSQGGKYNIIFFHLRDEMLLLRVDVVIIRRPAVCGPGSGTHWSGTFRPRKTLSPEDTLSPKGRIVQGKNAVGTSVGDTSS